MFCLISFKVTIKNTKQNVNLKWKEVIGGEWARAPVDVLFVDIVNCCFTLGTGTTQKKRIISSKQIVCPSSGCLFGLYVTVDHES